MPLDPQVRELLDCRAAAGTRPLYSMSVAEARAADIAAIKAAGGTVEPVAAVDDTVLPGPAGPIPVRSYLPHGTGPFPTLIYFFGGGWTLGSLETSDGVCRALTNAAGCHTVAVGYRLAPEHTFPAAVEDCFAAVRWLAHHGAELGADTSRLTVAGDSAGGNLAAVTALLARDDGWPPLSAQVLIYPNTDQTLDPPRVPGGHDLPFNERSVRWYRDNYLTDQAVAANPLASPLRAPDLSRLPPALVITAEYDPLRAEGIRYATRLQDTGVEVEHVDYPGMIHGFLTMLGELDASRQAVARIAAYLRARLDPSTSRRAAGHQSGRADITRGDSA
ncbi:MAG: alpha/beta hydrolase [bacterium]|nr:alpha/beta hydrolase [bacterium]